MKYSPSQPHISLYALVCLLAFLLVGVAFLHTAAYAQSSASSAIIPSSPQELRAQIESKSQELEKIREAQKKVEEDIEQTVGEQQTLSKELKQIAGNAKQLDLGIKSSQLTIEKLDLEIEDLGYTISDAETAIQAHKEAIADLVNEIREADVQSLLAVLLRNRTLSESFGQMQSLQTFTSQLGIRVNQLNEMKMRYEGSLALSKAKQRETETEQITLTSRKAILANQEQYKKELLAQTKNQEKAYKNILTDLQKQQASISDQIDDLDAALRSSFDESLLPGKRPGVFIMPVQGRITQRYGEVSRLYRGKPHNGLDIGAPIGTPIVAARDGKITAVGNNGRLQYGRYILIEHDNGLTTLYAHMSRQVAVKGQAVKRGDLIGYVGSTGYSTGAHLHLGLYWTASIKLQSLPGAGPVPIGVTLNVSDYM
jgi:murein DD-endopeptidase MepM/ murein hydrolase activator NlpD